MKKTILNLNNIAFKISQVNKPILQDINYRVQQGDFIILLGSNGSGKSSLLKLIDRRYQPTFGQIKLNQIDLKKYSVKEFAKQVITLTQNPMDSLFGSLTVLENCLLANERGLKHNPVFFENYLADFNVNLKTKFDTKTAALSGGEQQALALALSVLHPPQILLLDEHTSALDPKTADNILNLTAKLIQKHQITCILSTHDLETALNFGNKIVALSNGKILRCFDEEQKKKLTKRDLLETCYFN